VKRRDLIKLIDKIARERGEVLKLTEGGNHTKVEVGGSITVIPCHREISDLFGQEDSQTIGRVII
jgi:hydroxymethylglutaryl-CoA reductase